MNREKKIWRFLVMAGIVLMASVILLTMWFSENTSRHFFYNKMQAWDAGWYYSEQDSETVLDEMPTAVKTENADAFYIRNTLPQLQNGEVLAFENRYQEVEVIVGEESIYCYESKGKGRFREMLGNTVCIVELLPEHSGQEIWVYLRHPYSSERILIPNIYLTTKEAVGLDIWYGETSRIVFCAMLIVLMIILVLLILVLRFYDLPGKGIVSLLFFVMLSCIWLLTDSRLLVLGKWRVQLICVISFYAFLLMPIPLNSFLETVCGRKSKLLTANRILLLVNCIVQSVLYVAGIRDFMQMLPVTHLLDAVVIINILIFMICELRSKKTFYPKAFLAGSAGFFILSILGIVSFYANILSSYAGYYQTGIIIFALALTSMSFKHIQQIFREYNQAEVYKQIAYVDPMTQVRNRAAYERFIAELRDNLQVGQRLIVLMMDLNGLKQTNDDIGHGAGDKLICAGAECIRRTIGVRGEVYRIGGDEFVVFIVDPEVEQDYAFRLEQKVAEYNADHEIKLSIAIGVAEAVRQDMSSGWVRGVIAEADKNMYRHKYYQKTYETHKKVTD